MYTPLAATAWTDIASAWSDMIMTGLTLLTLGGVVYVAIQIRLQRKQMHRDLENLYIERYWTIKDRLDAATPGSDDYMRAAAAYLSLSEDQCDMRELERITDETWKIWGPSIYGATQDPKFAAIINKQPESSFLQLRAMQQGGPEHDPINLTATERRKEGLGR